jgi:hypothetical protein
MPFIIEGAKRQNVGLTFHFNWMRNTRWRKQKSVVAASEI